MASEKTVKVSPEAKALVERISDESGQTEKVIVDRLLRWAAHWHACDDTGRDMIGAIAGYLPAARRPDFARMVLQKLAEQPELDRAVADLESAISATLGDQHGRVAENAADYEE